MAADTRAPHQHVPPWFIAVFALAYISGYLIEYLYYGSLGIIDAAGDIFKLKYIQTGITFLLSSTVISVFIITIIFTSRTAKVLHPPKPGVHPTWYSIPPALVYIFSLYVSVILSPLHYVETNPQWIGIILLVALFIGYAIIFLGAEAYYRGLYNRSYYPSMSEAAILELATRWRFIIWARDVAAVVFLSITIAADFIFLYERRDALFDLVRVGGWVYLLFALLIPALVYRIDARLREAKEIGGERGRSLFWMTVVTGGALLCFALFVALLTYSYWVFPFIPSLKGGADYEDASIVRIIFNPGSAPKKVQSTSLLAHRGTRAANERDAEEALILYSTESAYYLAKPEPDLDPTKSNTPCEWRAGRKIPQIREVRRDEIKQVVMNPGAKESNCGKKKPPVN